MCQALVLDCLFKHKIDMLCVVINALLRSQKTLTRLQLPDRLRAGFNAEIKAYVRQKYNDLVPANISFFMAVCL